MKATNTMKRIMAGILSAMLLSTSFIWEAGIPELLGIATTAYAAAIDNFSRNYSLGNDPGQNMVNIATAQIGKTGSQLGYNAAWCAYFVSDCAELAGQSAAIPRHGRADYLDKNILNAGGRKIPASQAKPGDIAFYDNNYNNSPDHVEIVYSVSGNTVRTFGGNTGSTGSIYTNKVSGARAYGHILYIIRPNYSGSSSPTPTPDQCNCSTSYAGNYEVIGQGGLYLRSGHGTNYSKITMIPIGATVSVSKGNGSWAHVTYNGQSGYCSMTYLKKKSSPTPTSNNPDDYSPPTRNLSLASPYMNGSDVKWVQSVLYQLGYSITVDGIYGSGTKNTVMQFQKNNGLTSDGIVGQNTRKKMADLWNVKKLPSYKGISVSKSSYDISETVSITVNTINATNQTIGIDKNGTGRVITQACGTTYTISASKLGAGTYSAYFSVCNNAGYIDTERVNFSITDYRGQEMTTGAGYTIPNGEYIITSGLWQNLYLDIVGVNYPSNSGENVVICEDEEALFGESKKYDSWKVTYLNNGFYKISQNGTNMCLDVTNASLDRGTNVQICTDNGSTAQQWSIAKTSIGYKIQSKCNGYVLDVKDFNKASGTNVLVWEDAETKNQSWGFVPFASDDHPIADGDYYIKSACGNVWLDAAGDWNYEHGTNIQVWDSKTDKYSIKYVGDGYYRIYEVTSGLALNVYNTGYNCIENGVNVHLCDVYANSRAQLWRIKNEGNGYYSLISKLGGYVLDLNGGQIDKGTNVQQYAYNASVAQKWSFECAHSHYGDWTTTKAATCISNGTQTRKCLTCGKTETKTIAKTGHKYTTKAVEPTYTTQGYTLHTCSACGDSYKDNYTDKLLLNNSAISATNIILGQSIKLTAKATGGTAPYKYYYYYKASTDKNWIALSADTSATTRITKPTHVKTYSYMVKVVDKNGNAKEKTFTVKVNPELTNISAISETNITLGQQIELIARANGGTAPYKYYYYYKASTDTKWIKLSADTSATSRVTKPTGVKTYNYKINVVDANGAIKSKIFTVKVNPALENNSTITATNIELGSPVTLKASATGGTAPYKYYYYYKASNDTKWIKLNASTSTTSRVTKPTGVKTYNYKINVVDANGTIKSKIFTVKVNG